MDKNEKCNCKYECNDDCQCNGNCQCEEENNDDSIVLSPKYGVNLTTPICFFCGNKKKEIAMLGLLPNDAKAPESCYMDYTPCDDCTEKFNKGYTLIEVIEHPISQGQFPISENLYPTGRWTVISEEYGKKIFDGMDDILQQLEQYKKILVPPNFLNMFFDCSDNETNETE